MSTDAQRIRVALVEDDAAVRGGLEVLINNSAGCSCVAAFSNAEDALTRLVFLKPDIVLMDIQLPGLSGSSASANLKNGSRNSRS